VPGGGFNRHASAQFLVGSRLIDQFESGGRLVLDTDVANCLGMRVGSRELDELKRLYRLFGNALRQMSR